RVGLRDEPLVAVRGGHVGGVLPRLEEAVARAKRGLLDFTLGDLEQAGGGLLVGRQRLKRLSQPRGGAAFLDHALRDKAAERGIGHARRDAKYEVGRRIRASRIGREQLQQQLRRQLSEALRHIEKQWL